MKVLANGLIPVGVPGRRRCGEGWRDETLCDGEGSMSTTATTPVEIAPCVGGCGKEGPVPPDRHPALTGFLCDECRARIVASWGEA